MVVVHKVALAVQVLQGQSRAANVRVEQVRAGERVRELLPTACIEWCWWWMERKCLLKPFSSCEIR